MAARLQVIGSGGIDVRIRELIRHQHPITVRETDDLALAGRMMLWGNVHHLPVLGGPGNRVVGVLSERDILVHQVEASRRRSGVLEVEDAMSAPAIIVAPEQDVTDALEAMLEHRIGCLPVVHGHRLMGVVTRSDLLRRQLHDSTSAPDADEPTVGSLMNENPATTFADDLLLDAVARMEALGVRHLPVVNGDTQVVGMLSDRDVRSAIGYTASLPVITDALVRIRSMRVSDVMTHEPLVLSPDAPLSELMARLVDHRIGAVPVVGENDRLIGIVSYVDVLRATAELGPWHAHPHSEAGNRREGGPQPTQH